MESFADVKYILDGFIMLISGILVMWMIAGFTILEIGLNKCKNTNTILLKNIFLFAISSIMFYYIGYNLMYAEGNAFIGSGILLSEITNEALGHSIMADFFFQVVFVAISASVISRTFAQRIKLWPFLIFIIVFSSIIYPIQGHWTWGGSELGGLLTGFVDFAGSTTVHSVGGWAALAGMLILSSNKNNYEKDGIVKQFTAQSMPLATLGTLILWMGWFGFNGGSQLAMGSRYDIDIISLIIASTNMAAAIGAVTTAILSKLLYKKISLALVLNGALAGLVSVSAAPNISMNYVLIVAIIGAFISVFAVKFFNKLKIYDPLGALSIHLVAGIWGTLAVGIFGSGIFIKQLLGVVVIGTFVFISSYIVWKILDITIGIKNHEECT